MTKNLLKQNIFLGYLAKNLSTFLVDLQDIKLKKHCYVYDIICFFKLIFKYVDIFNF